MNFDLNIENYTRDELIQMCELPNNFDRNIVDIKESKLREGIINNNEINKDTRVKTLNFLFSLVLTFNSNSAITVFSGDGATLPEDFDTLANIGDMIVVNSSNNLVQFTKTIKNIQTNQISSNPIRYFFKRY